jgi:hypothetical protein
MQKIVTAPDGLSLAKRAIELHDFACTVTGIPRHPGAFYTCKYFNQHQIF